MAIVFSGLLLILIIVLCQITVDIDSKKKLRLEEQERKDRIENNERLYREGKQKAEASKEEILELSKKWKAHSVYNDVLNICVGEISLIQKNVVENVHSKQKVFSNPKATTNIKGECWKEIDIFPSSKGIYVDRCLKLSFRELGYRDLSIQEERALTLALGESLSEIYKYSSDIMIRTDCYQGSEEFVNRVRVWFYKMKNECLKDFDF